MEFFQACAFGGQCVTCAHARVQLCLRSGWLILGARLRRISSRIREIMCDSNHFTLPEPSRWSVPYSEINTVNVLLVRSSTALGGRGGKKWRKQHLAGLCSGFPAALMDLRQRINLLIEVIFVLSTVSSVYLKHILPSLNLPSALQMSFTLSAFWSKWDYEGLDHIWHVLVPIPVGGCNLTPRPFCLIIRWPACVAALCHIPALSETQNVSISLSFQLTVSFVLLCLSQIAADRDV